MSNQFYIYVHCRPSGEPFYVGKGSGKRAYAFGKKVGRNNYYKNIIAKYGKENITIYIHPCQSEQHAFDCEIWMIEWCRNQGHKLANLTNGGEGLSGHNHSSETKLKIGTSNSMSQIGKPKPWMIGNKNGIGNRSKIGQPITQKHKEKLHAAASKAMKNYWGCEANRLALIQRNKLRKGTHNAKRA